MRFLFNSYYSAFFTLNCENNTDHWSVNFLAWSTTEERSTCATSSCATL